ncbi:hypothetical protein [Petroclostridium sp. X23]|nr:hypothetical protein [Petroclostridium sp. X23]WHH60165.1 hypothetical protein QKW49_05370 [Petroclostridium sp. X23]
MSNGFLGGILDNDTVLWFIVLFLLLFWCNNFYGYGCSTAKTAVE